MFPLTPAGKYALANLCLFFIPDLRTNPSPLPEGATQPSQTLDLENEDLLLETTELGALGWFCSIL